MFQSRCRDSIIGDHPCGQRGPRLSDVSVPLPGFNYWRPPNVRTAAKTLRSFSPVAGIQLLATSHPSVISHAFLGFSPVAGIQLLATTVTITLAARALRVSVPLPGFNYWRLASRSFSGIGNSMFQSRCRDSIIGDQGLDVVQLAGANVSVPLPGFNYWRRSGLSLQPRGPESFSPVAGIQLLATRALTDFGSPMQDVSVPLPGFNYWRPNQGSLPPDWV